MAIDVNDAVWDALRARFFERKVVRDLLWTITSPHLIDAAQFPVLPVSFGASGSTDRAAILIAWLAAFDADPSPLVTFLRNKTTSPTKALALGVYFASLLEYWLRFCPLLQTTKFERSKQIVSATNQTLGQLKFLFRLQGCNDEKDERCVGDFHVEASVKFFILHPRDGQFRKQDHVDEGEGTVYPLEQFVGPHSGENLAWRVQEVARKLDLCQGESVQGWLREHYSDHVVSRIVLKGYLFYPLQHFHATADIARDHEWALHRHMSQAAAQDPLRHDDKIGGDHLRGWWTYDLAHEFPAKVRASDLGESRFFVLPKLYWLSPLVAEEDPVEGCVRIAGDDKLQLESIQALDLESLIALARAHFVAETAQREALPKGAVIMPLLVSEVVRCQPTDVEYHPTTARWREISRGFLLDPNCWDPLPLCCDAVRYKRTTVGDDKVASREYEGRREWANDGVVKPTDEEVERERQRKLHHFTEIETMTASRMCTELVTILHGRPKTFTHQNLKQSIQSVITHQQVVAGTSAGSFVLACLRWLVFETQNRDEEDGPGKAVPRIAHLILDAFEATIDPQRDGDCMSNFVHFFVDVASCEAHWGFVNLSLRGLDMVRDTLGVEVVGHGNMHYFVDAAHRLLGRCVHRWSAVAVEIVRVLFADATSGTAVELRRSMLDTLMEQQDWKNAEHLVAACSASDMQLLVLLFTRFNDLKMTKPLKRLSKIFSRVQGDESSVAGNGHAVISSHTLQHALGSPLDVDSNRARVVPQLPPLQWMVVDTPTLVSSLVETLHAMAQQQLTIVGLDCEWRPSFLAKETLTGNEMEGSVIEDIAHEEDDRDGVSVYQIAVGDCVYVVDVQSLGAIAQEPLRVIWQVPRGSFLLVGFCVASDLRRLSHSFPELFATDTAHQKLLVELKQLALYRQLPANAWGLSQLYEACFGYIVDKEQQCSDWGVRPLSTEQLHYAAMDAFAVRNITHLLFVDEPSTGDDLIQFVERFAVVTDAGAALAGQLLGQWITTLVPLNRTHVHSALMSKGLVSVAQSISYVDLAAARLPQGLLVKTIALALRETGRSAEHVDRDIHYVAVVLHIDASIDMTVLARHLDVHVEHVQLADRETLLRVFGYQRGCIGPIGLRESDAVHVVIDAALLTESAILPGAGEAGFVYAIGPAVLVTTVDSSVASIARSME